MADLIVLRDLSHGRRIAIAAGTTFDPTADGVIAREIDGELLGGMLYKDFTPASCFVHLAGIRPWWCNRALVWVGMDYPFRVLELERIFGLVPEHNARSVHLAEHLGFTEVTRIPGVHPAGRASIVYKLERQACRFLEWRQPQFTFVQGDR